LNSWDFKPPNGESQKQVGERMYTWMEKNPIKKYEQEPKVAVISHGMAIKCLLKKIMDFSPKLTYKILLDNTSITRLQYSQEGWSVIKINDTPHLN
jgi:broad specificity phosphatase PhoE